MKLHSLNRGPRDNRYCGPAVISFLTGVNTSEAARWIRTVSGQRAVYGTYQRDLLTALGRYAGIKARRVAGFAGKTLNQTFQGLDRPEGTVYLVTTTGHFQLVTDRRYACGRVGEVTYFTDERVKRRSRVEYVWELSGTPKLNPPPRPVSVSTKCRRLAKKIGVTIEKDIGYWVGPGPDWNTKHPGVDYHEISPDCNYRSDWDDVLEKLLELKEDLS